MQCIVMCADQQYVIGRWQDTPQWSNNGFG